MTAHGTAVFGEAVRMVGDALGIKLDEVRCDAEYAQTTEGVDLGAWTIPAAAWPACTPAERGLVGDVTRAPLRSADADLGGSELNLARMRGGLRPTSLDSARHPLLDTQRPRIPAQPSCNVHGPSRANGWSSPVGTNDPPIPQSVRCYSARSDRRFSFSASASSSTRSACARLASASVRLA
jgi:hypothetical protein